MLDTSSEVITPDNIHKLIQMGSLDSSWAGEAVSFSPSGDILVTTDINGHIKLYSMATGKLLTEIQADNGSISSIAFSPDGKLLAAGGGHKAQVWDLVTLEQIFKSVFRGTVYDVALSPDSSLLAAAWGGGGWACGSGGSIKLLDLSTGRLVSDFRLMGKGLPGGFDLSSMVVDMKGVAFSPDGKTLAGINACGVAAIWNISTHTEMTELNGARNYGYAVAYSPDGQLLATSGSDGSGDGIADLRIWNLSTSELLNKLEGHTASVTKVAFNPDGRILVSNSWLDGSVRLWDVATGDVLKVLEQNQSDNFDFSPDGTLLATGGEEGVILWGIPEK